MGQSVCISANQVASHLRALLVLFFDSRHLWFDSDFTKIAEQKDGCWGLCLELSGSNWTLNSSVTKVWFCCKSDTGISAPLNEVTGGAFSSLLSECSTDFKSHGCLTFSYFPKLTMSRLELTGVHGKFQRHQLWKALELVTAIALEINRIRIIWHPWHGVYPWIPE